MSDQKLIDAISEKRSQVYVSGAYIDGDLGERVYPNVKWQDVSKKRLGYLWIWSRSIFFQRHQINSGLMDGDWDVKYIIYLYGYLLAPNKEIL